MRDFLRHYGLIVAAVLIGLALGWWLGGAYAAELLARILR